MLTQTSSHFNTIKIITLVYVKRYTGNYDCTTQRKNYYRYLKFSAVERYIFLEILFTNIERSYFIISGFLYVARIFVSGRKFVSVHREQSEREWIVGLCRRSKSRL